MAPEITQFKTKVKRVAKIAMVIIIVGILAIIATIPFAVIHHEHPTNQAISVSQLTTLTTVSEQYRYRFQSYADSLSRLEAEGYIDSVLGSGHKSEYDYVYAASGDSWNCQATPTRVGETGPVYFFADESGVIRFHLERPATSNDTAVGHVRSFDNWVRKSRQNEDNWTP